MNRRGFLRRAACVAGALAVCPAVLIPKAEMAKTYMAATTIYVSWNKDGYTIKHDWGEIVEIL